jgi:hypothetical protein
VRGRVQWDVGGFNGDTPLVRAVCRFLRLLLVEVSISLASAESDSAQCAGMLARPGPVFTDEKLPSQGAPPDNPKNAFRGLARYQWLTGAVILSALCVMF